jgi:hypothetical protein
MEKNQISANLSESFCQLTAPLTGRRVLQLTSGPATCYPLYYFIPSISRDDRYLVYHKALDGEVQLHRLDLATGDSLQLTHATHPYTQWIPWCTDAGRGVLDHRSALNVARDEVIYFDGNVARAVHLHGQTQQTLIDRVLFTLPPDRLATGQNCVSPDGTWFFYIHHDKALYEKIYGAPGSPIKPGYENPRYLSKGTKLAGFHLDTGEHRTVVMLNAPIHHVHPCGADHLVFSSRATEPSILYTDYRGGWYIHLRTQTEQGGNTCHYCATRRGIVFEANRSDGRVGGGIVSPETRQSIEFDLPADSDYTHAGFDPEGRRLIYERMVKGSGEHDLLFLVRREVGNDHWMRLIGDWPTYGTGQKSHHHPRLVLGGQWVLITAGDPASRTNHLYLIDISDLTETII